MPDSAALLQLATRGRTQVGFNNIARRNQLAVYKRSVVRPNISHLLGWLVLRSARLVHPSESLVTRLKAKHVRVGQSKARSTYPMPLSFSWMLTLLVRVPSSSA